MFLGFMSYLRGFMGILLFISKLLVVCSNSDDSFFALSAFMLRSTVHRDESVTHFLFFHHFGGPHCRMMCTC